MELATNPCLDLSGANSKNGCLVELVTAAENEQASIEDRPDLASALDQHVVMDTSDGDIELMCARCPTMCTVKSVGGNALAILQDTQNCPKREANS